MVKILVSAALSGLLLLPALAADLPVRMRPKAPPAVAAVVYDWTGFYVGLQGGYGFGSTHHVQDGADTGNFSIGGALVGGTVGYNMQFDSWVAGLEADYVWSGIRGRAGPGTVGTFGCDVAPSQGCVTRVNHFGTARARLGFATDRFLVYGTGGFAFGSVAAFVDGAQDVGYDGRAFRGGWTAGGGVEYGIAPNLSARFEYLHVDLGSFAYGQAGTAAALLGGTSASARFNVVRGGLNWRFGGPVVTRY